MDARTPTRSSLNGGHTWRVVADLARDCPVTPAELDAVEAFLMPLVHALFADRTDKVQGSSLKQGKPAD
jgi:hypothetical protein